MWSPGVTTDDSAHVNPVDDTEEISKPRDKT